MSQLNSVIEGTQELLLESIRAIHASGLQQYVVIGGWCPYLRNMTDVQHPGTLDVDILIKDGSFPGRLKPLYENLLDSGFLLSAKHEFQLLKVKEVGGREMVFNLDLLHPRLPLDTERRLFVDHVDLDVPLDTHAWRVKKGRSIVQGDSILIFDEGLHDPFSFHGITFNLVDFTGMFLTKMDSCQKAKRERDSFDIYLGFASRGIDFSKLRNMQQQYATVRDCIGRFRAYLEKKSQTFDGNFKELPKVPCDSPADYILGELNRELQVEV